MVEAHYQRLNTVLNEKNSISDDVRVALKRLKRTQTTAGVSPAFEAPPLAMPVKDFKDFLGEGSLEISIGMSTDFRMSPYKECSSKHSAGFPLLKAACLHDVGEFTVTYKFRPDPFAVINQIERK